MTGRPPLYDNVESLQSEIDNYFVDGLTKKEIIIGKAPNQTTVEIKIPTISGLSFYLGFDSRQSFYDYEKNEKFSYTIKRARSRIEMHYEELLQTHPVAAGIIFALKNLGWTDKTEVENSGTINISQITGIEVH